MNVNAELRIASPYDGDRIEEGKEGQERLMEREKKVLFWYRFPNSTMFPFLFMVQSRDSFSITHDLYIPPRKTLEDKSIFLIGTSFHPYSPLRSHLIEKNNIKIIYYAYREQYTYTKFHEGPSDVTIIA